MHYLNIETLPLILYFGSVSLLSLMYGVLKFFQKYQHRRRNKQERNDVDDNEEKHTIKRDRKCSLQQLEQQQSEKKSRFTKWFWNMFIKLRLTNNNHKHVYFPSEQEKRFGIASQTAQQQQQNTNSYVDITGHDQELTNSTHGMYDTFSTYAIKSNWPMPLSKSKKFTCNKFKTEFFLYFILIL